MVRSMTGYGEAQRVLEEGILRVEIKTVNHRFLNASVRTPPGFDKIEHELQGWVRPYLTRGHVHILLSLERPSKRDDSFPELDMQRARHYMNLLRRLRDELDLAGSPDVAAVARFGDIFRAHSQAPTATVDSGLVRELVEEAAQAVVSMREAEGARLRSDMEERLAGLGEQLERIAEHAPGRLLRERDRLRAAVEELAGQTELDEDRLGREVAYLAERWDVNEEVVRFRSHLQLFHDTLRSADGEAVGKRLSFIVQEMHREANTIGAKANDSEIAHASVAMKEEIERLKEQVENVE